MPLTATTPHISRRALLLLLSSSVFRGGCAVPSSTASRSCCVPSGASLLAVNLLPPLLLRSRREEGGGAKVSSSSVACCHGCYVCVWFCVCGVPFFVFLLTSISVCVSRATAARRGINQTLLTFLVSVSSQRTNQRRW